MNIKAPNQTNGKRYNFKLTRLDKRTIAPAGFIFMMLDFSHKNQSHSLRLTLNVKGLSEEKQAEIAEAYYQQCIYTLDNPQKTEDNGKAN